MPFHFYGQWIDFCKTQGFNAGRKKKSDKFSRSNWPPLTTCYLCPNER